MPVLVKEVIACLGPEPGEIVADCTLGYGGHAREFIKAIGEKGRLVGLDMDCRGIGKNQKTALNAAKPR